MDFLKRLKEIEARKAEIRSSLQNDKDCDLEAYKAELQALSEEKRSIEERQEIANSIKIGKIEVRQIGGGELDNKLDESSAEYRSAFFKQLQGKELDEMEKRALTYTTSTAGAVVPTQTLNKIIEKLEQNSVLFAHTQHYAIAGNLTIGVESSNSECAWTAEGTAGTDSTAGIVPLSLSAYILSKFVSISAQISKMSIDALENFIVNTLTRKLNRAVDKAILDGTGTNQATGITKAMTFKKITTLDYDAICDIDAELNSEYSKNAVYIMNKKTRNLVKKIKNEIGDPIFVKDTANGFGDMLDGHRVIVYDAMADNKIVFGDLYQYVFNFASNPTIEKSKDAGFYQNAEVYRITALADGKPAMQDAFVGVEYKPQAQSGDGGSGS